MEPKYACLYSNCIQFHLNVDRDEQSKECFEGKYKSHNFDNIGCIHPIS